MRPPQTLEEAMADDHAGKRWVAFSYHTNRPRPVLGKRGWFRFDADDADWHGVGHFANWNIRRGGEFRTADEAVAFAAELNRLDAEELAPRFDAPFSPSRENAPAPHHPA